MIRLRSAVPFVVLLAMLMGACSSGSSSTGQPTQAGSTQAASTQSSGGGSNLPCAAIQADVVAAVGKSLGTLEATANKCEFKFGGAGDTVGLDGIVSVRLEIAGSTSLTSVKAGFPGGDDVAGLGDAAYWANSVYVMYAVSHGNLYAVQSVLLDSSLDLKGIQTKVMQSLLSHL